MWMGLANCLSKKLQKKWQQINTNTSTKRTNSLLNEAIGTASFKKKNNNFIWILEKQMGTCPEILFAYLENNSYK